MKREDLVKFIFIGIAVIGIIGCIALLFPQTRQVLGSIGGQYISRYNQAAWVRAANTADFWNRLLLSAALVYLSIIMVFLIISFSKFRIPQISPEKKPLIFAITEIGLISIYSCMLISLALASTIWLDEAYSLALIKYSWTDLLPLLVIDVHPPLYFFILKAASLVFGNSIAAMKMVSVFPTIFMVIFVCYFLKKEFSDKAAIIFLLFCFASETITHYSIEIRMYSWALFFVTLMAVSAWYFFKLGRKRWWIATLFCALGSAYTHSYAMAGAFILYLFLFFYMLKYKKDKLISMLLMAVFGIALYLPWLSLLIEQFTKASNNFWIPSLGAREIFRIIDMVFSTGNYFVTLFLCFMYGYVLYHFFIRKNKNEKNIFFFGGLCCAIMLVLTGIFISITIRPLFIAHYLVPMCGLVWLFFSIECSLINKNRVIAFIAIVFVIMGIMSISLSAQAEIKEKRDFDRIYTFLTKQTQQDDVFVFKTKPSHSTNFQSLAVIEYFFPNNIYAIYTDGFEYKIPTDDEFASRLWFDYCVEYENDNFHDRTAWIFDFDQNTENNASPEIEGEFSGFFSWSFYSFSLYRRSPPDINL